MQGNKNDETISLSTMVDFYYSDNTHKKAARRRRFKIVFITLAALALLSVTIILIDGLRSQTDVAMVDANTTGILGEAESHRVFDEKLFRFETDDTWERVDTKQEFERYNALTYRSRSNGLSVRELTIFVDEYPDDYELTYVLPVEIRDNEIEPFNISPRCDQLIKGDRLNGNSVPVNWAGVDFMCDPDRGEYLVGAVHNETGYGLRIAGTNSVHRYFFLYNDLDSSPQLGTFSSILRTFRSK